MNGTADAPVTPVIAPANLAQQQLTELGLVDLARRWRMQPDRENIQFGSGEPEEHTILGNPQQPFRGVAVLNPTPKLLRLGFGPKGGVGAALTVPAFFGLVWAAKFVDMSLAISTADSQLPIETVSVLRLPYPPAQPMAFQYGTPASVTAIAQPADTKWAAEAESKLILPAEGRRGVTIVNTGVNPARLMLGEAAKVGHGIYLAPSGGTWSGEIGDVAWQGSIYGLTEGGASSVSVTVV